MEKLFAPWRMLYIASAKDTSDGGCIFCRFHDEERDMENRVISRGRHCFVVLNIFPYNPGHLMVVPNRHTSSFTSLSREEICESQELLQHAMIAMGKIMSPQGFNLGMNIGSTAGAGIKDHLHYHLVPRWEGDTNFMPVIGDIRVIPEAIDATWRKMRDVWESCAS